MSEGWWLVVQFFAWYWGTKAAIYVLAEVSCRYLDWRDKRRRLRNRCTEDI